MSEILAPTAEDDAEARSRAEEQETLREVEELVRRQEWSALRARLEPMAPESVARILDALPPDESVQVWELLDKEQGEDVLDEMSDALQDSLDEEPDEAPAATAGDLQGTLQATKQRASR
jgi:magnesium transporter